MADEYKTCAICKDKTNCNFDLLLFGDWQQSRDVVVHYFCLVSFCSYMCDKNQNNH